MEPVGGLLNDIVVFAVFVYLLLLIKGKTRLKGALRGKFYEFMARSGKWFTILVYIGLLIFAVLLVTDVIEIRRR